MTVLLRRYFCGGRRDRTGGHGPVHTGAPPPFFREVGRQPLDGDGFAILVHTLGERDFGTFESLTYVTVAPASDAGKCRYEVAVHAYPHSCVRRFTV